jgi:hypothetical protein
VVDAPRLALSTARHDVNCYVDAFQACLIDRSSIAPSLEINDLRAGLDAIIAKTPFNF